MTYDTDADDWACERCMAAEGYPRLAFDVIPVPGVCMSCHTFTLVAPWGLYERAPKE